MKSWKKFLIVSLSFLFVAASVLGGLSNFRNFNNITSNNGSNNNSQNQEGNIVNPEKPNDYDGMVYYASEDEETGASAAPRDIKGGAVYVGNGTVVEMSGGFVQNHEGYYGGAVYVANGGTFKMSGGTIEYNYSKFGGAIYVEKGGICEITGGNIIKNKSENAAIYAEDGSNVSISSNAVIDNNEYIPFEKTIINFYVDGVCVDSVNQHVPTLNLANAPLSYEKSCGYFYNEDLTLGVEQGDDLTSFDESSIKTISGTTTNGENYHIFNLYTKSATVDAFTYVSDGTNKLKVSSKSQQENLVIPRLYNGAVVSSIGSFRDLTQISNVYMPTTIIEIPASGFYKSTLKNINLHNNIQKIQSYAFCQTGLSGKLVLPDNVQTIGTWAFANCSNITSVEIGKSALILEDSCFRACNKLESVKFMGPVQEIRFAAFYT